MADTKTTNSMARRGSYGVDAPRLLFIPIALVLYGIIDGLVTKTVWPFLGAVAVVLCSGISLHASSRGKFAVWAEQLDGLHLRGDEHLLDIGCGRGAVLLLAAGRLPTGQAVGVDLWRGRDQSGNGIEGTRRNAGAEGVADRVDVQTADMVDLPFPDGTFDVVVSSIAIHNVKGSAGRDRAITEAFRVLRPGGRLMIADFRRIGQYRRRLYTLGARDVVIAHLGWRMWWSGPWLATAMITATKP